MSPFYFGTGGRRLFGVYEPGRGARATVRAAVICHPWGSEYLHAHRATRQLSGQLALRGVHTLRFDYFGAGDSAGEPTAASLEGWEADILLAARELKSIADAARITLIGLRLGAALAAKAAIALGGEVESLVLWDPVVRGKEYLQDLHLACRTALVAHGRPIARSPEVGGGHEIMGFPLTASMARDLEGLDLVAMAPALPGRTLVVVSGPATPSHDSLERALIGRGAGSPAVERVASVPCWIEWPIGHANAGAVPVKLLQRIAEWVA